MACKTISDANPDIAGIGIILAFGLQALISLLLSATARFLLSAYFPLIGQDRKALWRILYEGVFQTPSILFRHTGETIHHGPSPKTETEKIIDLIKKGFINSFMDTIQLSSVLADDSPIFERNFERFGLGQIAKLAREELVAEERRHLIRSKLSRRTTKAQEKVQELICKVLLVASDAQTVTGVALIITAMIQQKSLSLYHLHIIYDTINFTTVSNIAAMSCVYDTNLESKRVRYFSIAVFGLLYTGFTIMLGVRLNDWNDAIPGRCYSTSKIALPNAKHPLVDQVYLGLTSFYVCSLMFIATMLCRIPSQRLYHQKEIIMIGTLQFILHLYTLVALRASNEKLLDNAALENEWGFGQVIAIIMLAATLLECAKGFEEYFSWKKTEAASSRDAVGLHVSEPGTTHSLPLRSLSW